MNSLDGKRTLYLEQIGLGELPDDWQWLRVFQAGEVLIGRQRAPKHEKGDHIVPYLRVANVLDSRIDYSDVLSMNFSPREQARYGLKNGDILLNEGQSLELVGRSAIYRGPDEKYCFQNTLVRFRSRPGTNERFAHYVFKDWLAKGRFQVVARQTTNIAHLGGDRFAQMLFPRPPLEQQIALADFLDEKTAAIDDLIAKKERLIELLEEKRAALINRAVTKGLAPDVPMKDSGIPWIGEIPEHWEVSRLGHLVDEQSGSTPFKDEPTFWGGTTPWVSPKDMKVFEISDSEDHVTAAALVQLRMVPSDSVLMVVRGMILARHVPIAITTRPVTINQDMKGLVPRRAIEGRFLAHYLVGVNDVFDALIEESGHGTKALRTENWKSLPVAVPPSVEQARIVEYLSMKLEQFDSTGQAIRNQLTHLAEYRQSLITAAVTGQLDIEAADGDAA